MEEESAKVIEKNVRAFLGRRVAARRKAVMLPAAIIVQSLWRRRQTAYSTWHRRYELQMRYLNAVQNRHYMATKIQARFRGNCSRAITDQMAPAALKIHRVARGFLGRCVAGVLRWRRDDYNRRMRHQGAVKLQSCECSFQNMNENDNCTNNRLMQRGRTKL